MKANRLMIIVIGTVLVALSLFYNFAQGKEVSYSSGSAVAYARMYCINYNTDKYKCWDPKNPNCENYNQGGGTDCANFMSQALIDGGITFSDCLTGRGKSAKPGELVDGAVVVGKDHKTKGLRLAYDLVTALKNSYCFKEVSASNAKAGDIVVDKSSTGWPKHVIMVGDPEQRYYYGHTSDRCSGDQTCYNPETKKYDKLCQYSVSATVL